MRIDAHAHILPPAFVAEADKRGGIGWPGELPRHEACLAAMDRYSIGASVVSPPVRVDLDGALNRGAMRRHARACNNNWTVVRT